MNEEQIQCIVDISYEIERLGEYESSWPRAGVSPMWQKRADLATERLGFTFTVDQYKKALTRAKYGPHGQARIEKAKLAARNCRRDQWPTFEYHRHFPKLSDEQKESIKAIVTDIPWMKFGRTGKKNEQARHDLWTKRAQLASERLGFNFTVNEFKKALINSYNVRKGVNE